MNQFLYIFAGAVASLALFLGVAPARAANPPCVAPCIVASNYNVVNHSVTTVNGLSVDQYMWFDSSKLPRTLSLKREGNGNSGHGGYAVQMTYVLPATTPTPHYYTVTVNADDSSDGGFGYFVSHERYRWFGNDSDGNPIEATIANKIFGVDDSPLGNGFPVTEQYLSTSSGSIASAAVRFSMNYHHYGTITPVPVNPGTGLDKTPLPLTKSSYQLYELPVTLTWVIEALQDDPRFDVTVGLGQVGKADRVNFDMRAPYGVMLFDDGADGTVDSVVWGDQAYLFTPATTPVTRSTAWNWNAANTGARFHALTAGGYEMGLYEPRNVASSATVDGYASERGYTAKSFAAAGGESVDYCSIETLQTLPSDGTWPFQSLQYSLPCPTANNATAIKSALTTPTNFKKIAWGTTAYYGSSLTGVYDGQKSFPFKGYPSNGLLGYQVCLAFGPTSAAGLTATKASAYITGNPKKVAPHCATAALATGS